MSDPLQSEAVSHFNLGVADFSAGRFSKAAVRFKTAADIVPDYAEAYVRLSYSLLQVGDLTGAMQAARLAARLEPGNQIYIRQFATTLRRQRFASIDNFLFNDLSRVIELKDTIIDSVAGAVLSALKLHPDISTLLLGKNGPDVLERLSRIPLLLRMMTLIALPDHQLELAFTKLRRESLKAGSHSEAELPFLAALALQCFNNEYAYAWEPEETEMAARLADQVCSDESASPHAIAVLASYRPLYRFPSLAKLIDVRLPPEVTAIVRQQIVEPIQEAQLQNSIPILTAISDKISEAVKAQYEINPYPRWIKVGLNPNPISVNDYVKLMCPSADLPRYQSPMKPEVLVAGCGTGRHALIVATVYKGARILAVDLSTSSLAYALRKTADLGIDNIEYGQADLLSIGALGRMFDVIECVGVLHHMADPAVGLKSLVSVLRPGGFIRLGLYSELERRRWLSLVRAMTADLPVKDDQLRSLRQEIITKATGENQDPVLQEILDMRDFYSLSDCRDLLWHVNEHRFDAAGIKALVDAAGLQFIGFEEPANEDQIRKFRRLYSKPRALASLSLWASFEKRYMPISYRFFCRKPA